MGNQAGSVMDHIFYKLILSNGFPLLVVICQIWNWHQVSRDVTLFCWSVDQLDRVTSLRPWICILVLRELFAFTEAVLLHVKSNMDAAGKRKFLFSGRECVDYSGAQGNYCHFCVKHFLISFALSYFAVGHE